MNTISVYSSKNTLTIKDIIFNNKLMEVTLNVHNLIRIPDPNNIGDSEFDQYCGQLVSSATFIADDSLMNDMRFGITQTGLFERIELLRILDEYISDGQREKFKTEILDNFLDGKNIVIICCR